MMAASEESVEVCCGCGRAELVARIGEYVQTYQPTARVLGQAGRWHPPCLIQSAW